MEFVQSNSKSKNYYTNVIGGGVTGGGGGTSVVGGNYLPAKQNEDGTYTVDLKQVNFNGNITAQGEIQAYSEGDTINQLIDIEVLKEIVEHIDELRQLWQ